jgi:O-antigen/teichoic acid export membrane protein
VALRRTRLADHLIREELVNGTREAMIDEQQRHFDTAHLMKNVHARSFRGAIVTLGGQAARLLLQIASTMVLAHLLRPQDFGLVAMVTAITAFVTIFQDLGLSNATVQRAKVTHAQVSTLFWVNSALGVGVMIVVGLLAPEIAWFYHEPRLVHVTLALSVTFALTGITVQHRALLRRQMQFKLLTVIDTSAMAAGIGAAILLAWMGFGYWSLVGLQFVGSLVACALVWLKCSWKPGAFKRMTGVRPMLAFGGNLAGFNVLNYFTRNFDNVLIGRVLGSSALGIYAKAYGLLTLPVSQINQPITAVLIPSLSRLHDNSSEYSKLFLSAARAMLIITLPLVVFSFFLARDVVLVLLGPQWLPVAPVFQLLTPAAATGTVAFVPNWLCQSLGRTRQQLHYALVSAPVCVTGFLIGIRWGVEGVATSFSVTFVVLYWAYVWYTTNNTPVRFSEIATMFLSGCVPAFVAGLIVWLLRRTVLASIEPVVAVAICGMVFFVLYLVGAMASRDSRSLVLAGTLNFRRKL